ncbi:MAG: phosphomevalonate kinase, partial [Brevibacterium sp.]|nr:phosphomevalonate kinase [Brevibacterium sp.]
SGSQIETEQLRSLCDIAETYGAAAKPSGAGGGDCGIALSEADLPTIDILREWERHGIQRLSLSPHRAEGGIDEF